MKQELVDTLGWDAEELLGFNLNTDYLYKQLLKTVTLSTADGFMSALESVGPLLGAIQEARGLKEGALVLGDADNNAVREAIAAYLATEPTLEQLILDGKIEDFEYWAYKLFNAPKLTALVTNLIDCQKKMASRYDDVRRATAAWQALCDALNSDAFAQTYAALHKTAEVVAKNELKRGETFKFDGFVGVMTKLYQPTNPDYKRRLVAKGGKNEPVTLCYFAAQLFGAHTGTMRVAIDALDSALKAMPEGKDLELAQSYAKSLADPGQALRHLQNSTITEETEFVAALAEVRPSMSRSRRARPSSQGVHREHKKSINSFDSTDPVKEEGLRSKLRALVDEARIGIDQWELECRSNPADPEVRALCLAQASAALQDDLRDEADADAQGSAAPAAPAASAAAPTPAVNASLDEAFGALQFAPVGEAIESVEAYFVERSEDSGGGGGGGGATAAGGADWRARYLLTQLEARYEPVLQDLKLRAESDVLTACAVLAMSRIAPARVRRHAGCVRVLSKPFFS